MENTTVDGLTREEWADRLHRDGVPQPEIDEILAISFGDVPGDAINITEHPDLADDGEEE